MKKTLVTGASGLVGYDVAKLMKNNQEQQIYITCHNREIEGIQNAIKIDLEKSSIEELNIKFDYIIHCAARIPTINASDKEIGYINRKIDDNIINYCIDNECKLIYMSSTSLYGNNYNKWISEMTSLDIHSNYALQKKITEEKICDNCEKYFILRISSPYGIRMQQNNVLKIFWDRAREGQDILYYGSGSRTQNFTNVLDISTACVACFGSSEYGIYNIASCEAVSMKCLAELFAEASKKIYGYNISAKKSGTIDTQEDVRNNIDITLAREKLSWIPKISIKEGVQQLLLDIK